MDDSSNFVIKDNQLTIKVNAKIYPIEAVYSAAYVFLDRAYIVLDGDPNSEILVNMKLKQEGSLDEIGNEFNNELLTYADYLARSKATIKIRETLLQRALLVGEQPAEGMQEIKSDDFDDLDDLDESLDDDYLDDPEGIAVPWEEKYGKSDDCCGKNEDKAE